jgi:hypothetical protein
MYLYIIGVEMNIIISAFTRKTVVKIYNQDNFFFLSEKLLTKIYYRYEKQHSKDFVNGKFTCKVINSKRQGH